MPRNSLLALFSLAISCGPSGHSETKTEDNAFLVSDVTLEPDGGFTATYGLSDAGYPGCEDFCAQRWAQSSAIFVGCEGPVPIDPTLRDTVYGPDEVVVVFDDGGVVLPIQGFGFSPPVIPPGGQAIRCTMQLEEQITQPNNNSCGPGLRPAQ